MTDDRWQTAVDGLKVFLLAGHGDEALRLCWSHGELFRVPQLWSQVHFCGVALLIGDREVTAITPTEIRTKTASGATQSFYRRPEPDWSLVFRERFKLLRRDVSEDEAWARSYDFTIASYCSHHGRGLEGAKKAVLAALKENA